MKGLTLRIVLLENILYRRKISGMYLLNDHMNTLDLLIVTPVQSGFQNTTLP